MKGTYPESCVVELCHARSGTHEWLYISSYYILQGSYLLIIYYRGLLHLCRALSWMYILHFVLMERTPIRSGVVLSRDSSRDMSWLSCTYIFTYIYMIILHIYI